jgi:DNA mismatch repair protein MutS
MIDFDLFKEKYNYVNATPMMQQYLDAKYQHQDCLVLFRMGDFYELFNDDAIACSKLLGIALSRRGKTENLDIQMCGVPYHSINAYLPRLIAAGYKVAICEQMESPDAAKKERGYKAIVKREVVKIITQGTLIDENLLDLKLPNYLASIVIDKDLVHVAYSDLSTFDFFLSTVTIGNLLSELERINPKEILISENIKDNYEIFNLFNPYRGKLVFQVASYFSLKKSKKVIEDFYKIQSIESLGNFSSIQICSIGSILEYIRITQKTSIPDIGFPKLITHDDYMIIDSSTRRNLELLYSSDGKTQGSVISIIDKTVTSGGSRLLYNFVGNPIAKIDKINNRLELTDLFLSNLKTTENIRKYLSHCHDIERMIARISMNKCLPKDLIDFKNSLKIADVIKAIIYQEFSSSNNSLISYIKNNLTCQQEIIELIDKAILDEPQNDSSKGHYINPLYHPKILELKNLINNSNVLIKRLENKYINKTQISSLKILSNNLMGFFIEIKPKNSDQMSDPIFIHKQTLSSGVRFTTVELQNLESSILNSSSLLVNLEKEIFENICNIISKSLNTIKKIANCISLVDVFTNFAIIADENKYSKPEITDSNDFEIINGRHNVVEKVFESGQSFVPNDCNLNFENRVWLITGPNMAGKSTFLKQNALIAILSHIGCFVPAQYAKIGVIDMLFSRIGANDNLAKGHSTFMVEMIETSRILAQSTEKSFIILDEVGRGTATYDGVAIAWAALEHIHDKLRCRCLFATHYHELVALENSLPSLRNYTVKVDDEHEKILFLYKIIKGAASKSYGIHVAELSGIPNSVIKRAKELLKKMEIQSVKQNKILTQDMSYTKNLFEMTNDDSEYKKKYDNIVNKIKEINPDNLTPKEALEMVYKLTNLIK